jgi:AraC-like DNA-binding protein
MQGVSLEELGRDPVGRYVGGETFVHFCASPGLWGVLLWGRPSEADARQLGRSLVFELAPPAQPHVSIVDASRLDGGDAGAFGALERYVTRYAELLHQWVLRLAVVRPGGLGGAMVAGAYEVLPRPYPVAVFGDPRAALDWLAPAGDGPPHDALATALSELYAEAQRTPAFVSALRVLLDGHLGGVPVTDAASALGMSERTLQRKLSEVGTTFQDEMGDARVRAAKRMLLDGDAPLTEIAFEVGCASLQHFSALFRKRTGRSPSAWRKLQRAARVGSGPVAR